MRGRPVLCGILLAHVVVVFAPQLSPLSAWAWMGAGLLALAGLCLGMRARLPFAWRGRVETLAWTLAAVSLALLVTAQRAWWRLDDALALGNVDRVSRVTLRVAQLPQLSADHRRFRAQVLSSEPAGVPQHVMVSWFAPGRRGPFAATPAPWPFPEIVPGQVWRMALNLRPPAGERNPHAFDVEGHMFAQGIRAVGSVRGTPVLLRDEPWADLGVAAQRLRHRVRAAMQPYVQSMRYGAVLTALAIGDQAGVSAADWQVFNRSGMTHLVSISGSHITMLAVLGGVSACWVCKRVRWRRRWMAERVPAQLAGAWAALLVAWLYCLLAGWGVPARRTFVMLATLALAYTARLPLTASRVLLLAAGVVVVLDPWALMASGFWLSFGAVAVLMASRGWEADASSAANPSGTAVAPGETAVAGDAAVASGGAAVAPGDAMVASRTALRESPAQTSRLSWRRIRQTLWVAARLQLAITLALMPLLARLFHEMSLVSPLVNAYAIPVVGLLITPLALLLALLACIPGADWLAQAMAWLAHGLLAAMMQPTQWLAAFPAASIAVPAVPWGLTILAVAGMAWALLPAGARNAVRASDRTHAPQIGMGRMRWMGQMCRMGRIGWMAGRARHVGWLLLLPALLWRPDKPAPGDWRLTVLDTGQSGAAVLQTRSHAFLFDTGKRTSPDGESGSRTIVPFLRSQGIRQLDAMVVSHADLDHAGGASGVLRAVSVHQAYASFDLPAWLRREARLLGAPDDLPPLPQQHATCAAGRHWEVDGVSFTFLWPLPRAVKPADADGVDLGTQQRAGQNTDQTTDHNAGHNASSCVLLVRGAHHAVLLTGDIHAAQERALLDRGLKEVDVVLAPHHGSRFSSSDAFVAATRPAHVIAQAGLFNPFGHPHPATEHRWARAGASLWRTDLDGAVQVQSAHGILTAYASREHWPRYWQLPCDVRQACVSAGND